MGPCKFDARENPSSRSRISTLQSRKRNQDKFQPSGPLDWHASLPPGLGLLRSLSCSSLTFLVYKDQCFGYFKIVKGLAQKSMADARQEVQATNNYITNGDVSRHTQCVNTI